MADKSFALEALFTPEWSAIYDPLSRSRWSVEALLDPRHVAALCAPDRTSEQESLLRESELVCEQTYDKNDVETWAQHGWSDPLRHYLHTNFLPKLDYGVAQGWVEDFKTMREKVAQDPAPALTKSYSTSEHRRTLVGNRFQASYFDITTDNPKQRNRTATQFDDLAALLVHVFGASGEKSLAVTGRHITRTSPSGGSRHPTEAYVLVFNIEGIASGAYHFNAESHELEIIQAGDLLDDYLKHSLGLNRRVNFIPKAAIILTSIPERSMHRYRDSRSYRVLHFDVGHLLLSAQLVARAINIPYFCSYSIADESIEKTLGIDGLMETAMCQIALG